jgi:hypothetical protein
MVSSAGSPGWPTFLGSAYLSTGIMVYSYTRRATREG